MPAVAVGEGVAVVTTGLVASYGAIVSDTSATRVKDGAGALLGLPVSPEELLDDNGLEAADGIGGGGS